MMKNLNRTKIGYNALNGKPVSITEDDRATHMHIIGTTGAGKSKEIEWLIRQDILKNRGVCLVDPHGDLYKDVLKFVIRLGYQNRVILIDPNDENWAVGLNYLEYDPEVRSATAHASEAMRGISKVFGGENTDIMPRLQRWQRDSLVPLTERKLTLIEVAPFIQPGNVLLRKALLEKTDYPQIAADWEFFDEASKLAKENYIEAVINRAQKFAGDRIIRRMFGQVNSTINFSEAMDKGKIILCSAACEKISKEARRMLGVVILDKIIQAGYGRISTPRNYRRPFYVYLDEFGLYVSEDIAEALWGMRKFNIRFILVHQELAQLRDEDPKVFSAVVSEPGIKIAFRTSRADAEIIQGEIFKGGYKPKVKRRIFQTKYAPKEETRKVEMEASGMSEAVNADGEHITTDTYSDSTTTVPFITFEEFQEMTSEEDFSTEEIREKYIAWINTQPDRRAQVKIRNRKPVPIVTPTVKEVKVSKSDVEMFKSYVYQRYALPAKQVDLMIEKRHKELLALSEGPNEMDFWKPIDDPEEE